LPNVSSDVPSLSMSSVSNWRIGNMRKGMDGDVFLLGTARSGLVSDSFVVSDGTVRHDVGEILGREVDVVFGQRQFAVPVLCVRVCRCDWM
jgi:hypothetical protein